MSRTWTPSDSPLPNSYLRTWTFSPVPLMASSSCLYPPQQYVFGCLSTAPHCTIRADTGTLS